MSDLAPSGAGIYTAMLDALCDALGAAVVVYDGNDRIVFASRKILSIFPLREEAISHGARLRDYLGALYDCCLEDTGNPAVMTGRLGREEWIGERLALHWRERSEKTERHKGERWLRFVMNRLPSGLGISVVADISEQKNVKSSGDLTLNGRNWLRIFSTICRSRSSSKTATPLMSPSTRQLVLCLKPTPKPSSGAQFSISIPAILPNG